MLHMQFTADYGLKRWINFVRVLDEIMRRIQRVIISNGQGVHTKTNRIVYGILDSQRRMAQRMH